MTHKCPKTGCTKKVQDDMLACPPHWYQVPRDLRTAVWVAWENGEGKGTPAHNAAIAAAIEAMNRAE